jgi:hypothetical protein
MKNHISPSSVLSLKELGVKGTLVAFNVGPDGEVFIVYAMKPTDYQFSQGLAIFPKIFGEAPQVYRILKIRDATVVMDMCIENEKFNIHDVQPMADKLLLASARSEYRGSNDFDLNGRAYSRDGVLVSEILLGDGVQSIQATRSGEIWVSYFDEGVLGNFGWDKPFGASGLLALDHSGQTIYQFEPNGKLDHIVDCYALNVATDSDVWCYYYTDFPLVQIQNKKIVASWNVPVSGSSAFAIDGDLVLFAGGYDHRKEFEVVRLNSDGTAKLLRRLSLRDAKGAIVVPERIVGRGAQLFVLSGESLYEIKLEAGFL